MRRMRVNKFGPPDVLDLEDVPDPMPAEGQVMIDVDFAGVTFVETQVRLGRPPWAGAPPALPYYPGNAIEGSVVQVGPNASEAWIGSRVAASTGGAGGYADRAVVRVEGLIRIPPPLPPGHAVALLADGRTAISVLRAARVDSDAAVIVTAAAGGVGTLLVQLALNAGVRMVIALAGGEEKCELALSLGAHVALDYRREGWKGSLQTLTDLHRVNTILDGVGGEVGRELFDMARPRTQLCVFGMSSGAYTDASVRQIVERGITLVGGVQLISPAESKVLSQAAMETAARGDMRPILGRTFPLAEAAQAHAAIEGREVIGKTLLDCRSAVADSGATT